MLNDFLNKLLADDIRVVETSAINPKCKIPSAMLDTCIQKLKGELIEFGEFEAVEGTYAPDNGYKLGRYTDAAICYVPSRLEVDGTELVSVDGGIHAVMYFDSSFNLQKKYNLSDIAVNRYPKCLAVTDTKIYVGTRYYRLLCIDKATGNIDWEYGIYGRRGKCIDGYIGTITQIQTLSNGNILVSTYDGAGDANKYVGTVEEFDATGKWLRTLLQYNLTGQGADMETRNVRTMRVYNDVIYIGKSDVIDVFDYTTGTLNYVQTIRKPSNSGVDELFINDFVIDNGILYIVSSTLKMVIGFNLTTNTLEFSSGFYSYEASGLTKHRGNGLNNPTGIAIFNGEVIVSDSGNYNITKVFKDNFTYPKYNIPANIDVIYSSLELNGDVGKVPVGVTPEKLALVYRNIV